MKDCARTRTKRAWIYDIRSGRWLMKTGASFMFIDRPTERAGFTTTREAKHELYIARRMFPAANPTIVTF